VRLPACHSNIYTQEEFAQIAGSFKIKQRPPYSPQERIEKFAWFFKEGAGERDPLLKPHKRLRRLESCSDTLEKGLVTWRAIIDDCYLEHAVRTAALRLEEEVERNTNHAFKPNFEFFECTQIAVDEKFEEIDRVMDRACELLCEAVADLEAQIASGGKRANVPLREFVRDLWMTYLELAAEPKEPNGWAASADERSGEFLDFLSACLSPLEKRKRTPSDLFQLYRRACA
jgi:hypothetical protein